MEHGQRRLHIAFLDSWLQDTAAGSGTAVAIGGLGAALQQQGHHVDRVAPPTAGVWGRLPLTLRRMIFNLFLPLRLCHTHYDLVVGFDWDGVWLGIRGWGLGVGKRQQADPIPNPYICSIKGIIAEELQHERGRIRLLFMLLAKLEGANARRADRVITTSEYCRRKIVEHYGVSTERIGIVPEGINVRRWEKLPRSLTPNPQPLVILCVARHYPRKHIDDLIRAFALIHTRVPHVRLRIVGDGPEHAKLIALADQLQVSHKLTFTGSIADEDVRREYVGCDVFCLPSVQEGFGIVFLEAMAAGKPVVSTTAAAIGEVVQHGETGVLVPPGDVHALAGALLFLLGNADARTRYGANGYERVQRFDWQHVVEQFLQEVEQVV